MSAWKLVPVSGNEFKKVTQDFRASFHPHLNNIERALFVALNRAPKPPEVLQGKALAFNTAQRVTALEAENERLRVIRCPDGKMHRWDGDGQCKACANYATDLIDAALRGESANG